MQPKHEMNTKQRIKAFW